MEIAKRTIVALAVVIAISLIIAVLVMMTQNIGSGRFGRDWSACRLRMKHCYSQIKFKLSMGSEAVTSETVGRLCGRECACTLAKGNANTGWTWIPDLQRSDFVGERSGSPRVILCHSPDCPHGTRDPRLWMVLLSDGSVRIFRRDLVDYRRWFNDVFMAGKDVMLPE